MHHRVCDQVLHSLQVYWRTLNPITNFKLLGVSQVLGFVQRDVSTKSRPIGNWRKNSTIGYYFGIDQVWSKISCTCNLLILISDSWEWWPKNHSVGLLLCERFFPLINKTLCKFIFHCTLDYLVICSCLHDFHLIWHNYSTWVIFFKDNYNMLLTLQLKPLFPNPRALCAQGGVNLATRLLASTWVIELINWNQSITQQL